MIKIENKPVGPDPIRLEIRTVMRSLKVGQSCLIDPQYSEVARGFGARTEGKFATRSEGGQLRVGRIA